MKNLIITFTAFFLIISCRPAENTSASNPFSDYLNKIPVVSLPLDFNYRSNIEIMPNDKITAIEKDRYNPREIPIIGKIDLAKDIHAIVYFYLADWSIPIIVTYTETGTKIDSLAIYAGYRNEEEHIYVNSSATINKNFSIEVIDTTITYKTDSLYLRIDSIGIQEIKNDIFSINRNGKIVKR